MNVFDEIHEIAAAIQNPRILEAKRQGRRVMGYLCSYVPEEIIHAAGFVPYRLRAVGSTGTEKGDAYFSALNCSFIRHCFDLAARGEYDFLDGVVFFNGCDHSRRMYDNWRDLRKNRSSGPDFLHMLIAPHKVSPAALARYEEDLAKLIRAMESHFGIAVTRQDLSRAIVLYNEKRSLMAQVYAMRQAREAPITGAETLSLALAVNASPVEQANLLLERVVDQCQSRVVSKPGDLRLFVSGGCLEEVGRMRLIEDLGAVVVADNLCLGARPFDQLVEEDQEPLAAIARRYLTHLSCPRMINDFASRSAYMEKMIREARVDAIIADKLKFCDLWGGETFLQKSEAKRLGAPFLALEREMYGGGAGQARTRVQAFFEKVRNVGGGCAPPGGGDNFPGGKYFS